MSNWQGPRGPQNIPDGPFTLHLKGLPFKAKKQEILKFMELTREKVDKFVMVKNDDGRPSGIAFMVVKDAIAGQMALNQHRGVMPGYTRYMEVIRVPYQKMIDSCGDIPEWDGIVQMKGLPFKANILDVEKFLEPVRWKEDGIYIPAGNYGNTTGVVWVQFDDFDQAEACLDKNNNNMHGRYIQCTESSNTDMRKAKIQELMLRYDHEQQNKDVPGFDPSKFGAHLYDRNPPYLQSKRGGYGGGDRGGYGGGGRGDFGGRGGYGGGRGGGDRYGGPPHGGGYGDRRGGYNDRPPQDRYHNRSPGRRDRHDERHEDRGDRYGRDDRKDDRYGRYERSDHRSGDKRDARDEFGRRDRDDERQERKDRPRSPKRSRNEDYKKERRDESNSLGAHLQKSDDEREEKREKRRDRDRERSRDSRRSREKRRDKEREPKREDEDEDEDDPFKFIVSMFNVTEEIEASQIQEFFRPCKAIAVNIGENGEVDVAFKNHEHAVRAMNKDKEKLMGKRVELKLNSKPSKRR